MVHMLRMMQMLLLLVQRLQLLHELLVLLPQLLKFCPHIPCMPPANARTALLKDTIFHLMYPMPRQR
jgi:hypothetical protein